jgi:integrase
MPNASPTRTPSYRKHKPTGQAVVTLNGRDIYLGRHGSKESKAEYDRLIAEWLVAGRRLPVRESLSVNELALAYWRWAISYYRWGKHGGYNLKDVLRIAKELYGHTPAVEFGPLALKACRQKMTEKDWCRTYVNAQVDRLRRMFRWAAAEEMLPASVYEQLHTVEGLRRGRTDVREGRKVKPVALEHVEATLPFLPPTVQAMVRFQLLTGCRPAEVCLVRPIDIDLKDPTCWAYRPHKHKTEHYDQERVILIGPRAQDVLRPFLGTKVDGYCFSLAAAEAERSAKRRQARKTKVQPSQAKRVRKTNRKRAPGDHYDVTSYRNAILRACAKADAKAHEDNPAIVAEQPLVPAWKPNQLRHARATELRKVAGLDVCKTILGHNKVETTQIYAEKDLAAAKDLVAKIG